MRNNISYAGRILYRLCCLVSSCPSFIPPFVNNLLCKIEVELCRVPVIPPLTILTKIVGINIFHSKDWSINSDTPIIGLNPPLQLDIILPHTVNPQLHGQINYDATPLAPPVTQVLIHKKPTVRGKWSSHGVKGWYLGPSMDHYICHHVYVTKTRGERESGWVNFFSHNTPLPYNSSS